MLLCSAPSMLLEHSFHSPSLKTAMPGPSFSNGGATNERPYGADETGNHLSYDNVLETVVNSSLQRCSFTPSCTAASKPSTPTVRLSLQTAQSSTSAFVQSHTLDIHIARPALSRSRSSQLLRRILSSAASSPVSFDSSYCRILTHTSKNPHPSQPARSDRPSIRSAYSAHQRIPARPKPLLPHSKSHLVHKSTMALETPEAAQGQWQQPPLSHEGNPYYYEGPASPQYTPLAMPLRQSGTPSPAYGASPHTPHYLPTSPTLPAFRCRSVSPFEPMTSPMDKSSPPTSPAFYRPTSRGYISTSPGYIPTSPGYMSTSPGYELDTSVHPERKSPYQMPHFSPIRLPGEMTRREHAVISHHQAPISAL